MRRYVLVALGLLITLTLFFLAVDTAHAAGPANPGAPESPAPRARYACVPSLIWRTPQLCPSYGPGTTAYRLAAIRLPDPLPELPIEELPREDDEEDLLPHTFAHIVNPPLAIYGHPMEAAMGLPPKRMMLSGDWWVSIDGEVEYEGQLWYQINPDEFVLADELSLARPSRFQGVALAEQPSQPFAWTNRWVQPLTVPQGPSNIQAGAINRYQLVTIFAEEQRGGELWYLIGPDQWVEEKAVARVDVDPRPEGVPAGAKWVEVDIYEQTIAAYEGDRMVYASLISSGRSGTATPPGLYHLWAKLREGKMSNPDVEDGSLSYYYIEDVPWTMYFHGAYALHAAFWHDAFGFTQSHGCVNLTPRDSQWFFNWTDPYLPEDRTQVYIGESLPTTWVWVHFTPPF